MTKDVFDQVLSSSSYLRSVTAKKLGYQILSSIPLFHRLDEKGAHMIIDSMTVVEYHPNSYICRHGAPALSMYLITEGMCRVSTNKFDSTEQEIKRLVPGDYFGDDSLIIPKSFRPFNVMTMENVTCLMISRSTLEKFGSLFEQSTRLQETFIAPSKSTRRRKENTCHRRRITAFGDMNEPNLANEHSIVRRMCTFFMDSAWISQYWKMFRNMIIHPKSIAEYGPHAEVIMAMDHLDRHSIVEAVRSKVYNILVTHVAIVHSLYTSE